MNNNGKIPLFIKLRGCINCEISKRRKEKLGTYYGIDAKLQENCLKLGCRDYGVDLVRPFLDPEELLKIAKKDFLIITDQMIDYVNYVNEVFGKIYNKEYDIDVNHISYELKYMKEVFTNKEEGVLK